MGHMSYFTVPDPFKKDLAELTAVACMLADHGYRVMAAGRDAGRTEKLREYSPGDVETPMLYDDGAARHAGVRSKPSKLKTN